MKKLLHSLLVIVLIIGAAFGGLYFDEIKSWTVSLFEREQSIDDGDNGGDISHSSTFANDDWSIISQVSNAIASGEENIWYKVGDEKGISIDGVTYTLVILGFNHDNLSDGTGKAGISIGLKEALATKHSMNTTNSVEGGWAESNMRNTIMPNIFSQLPSKLQSVIKPVDKVGLVGGIITLNPTPPYTQTTSDKLWLYALPEVGIVPNTHPYRDEGKTYEYFSKQSIIPDPTFVSGVHEHFWASRTPSAIMDSWVVILANGNTIGASGDTTLKVLFGFAV